MKKLLAAAIIGALAAVLISADHANAEPESEDSAVRSVLVTQDGRPIGSLSSPAPGSTLVVEVEDGTHQLQAIIQIAAVPGQRYLLLTELENAVVTGLSEDGVVGSVLDGGWILDAKREQLVHINLAGNRPQGADEFDLVQGLSITADQVLTEFRVEANVVRPVVPLPLPLLSGAVGAGAVTVLALAIFIWGRARRNEETHWNY